MKLGIVGVILVTLLLLTPARASAWADRYNPFRFNLGLIGAIAPGDPGGYGGGLALEPMLNIFNQLSVGARFEGSAFGGGSLSSSLLNADVDLRGVAAILAKTELFFTQSTIRPFIAFGLGAYYTSSASYKVHVLTNTLNASGGDGWHFGIAPQVGLDLGFVRLAGTYHVLFGKNDITTIVGEAAPAISYNYFALELTFLIGGSRKD